MSEWKEYRLGEIANIISESVDISYATEDNYISTENMINDFGGVVKAKKTPVASSINSFIQNDILFSNIRTYFKKVWLSKFNGTVSPDVLVFRSIEKKCISEYLYYSLCNPDFTEYSVLTSKGAKMPRGDKDALLNYVIQLPPLSEQKSIASVLSSLDDKIDLLHRQNTTLEKMAETLFRQWFVEEAEDEWEEKPLSSIANFLNGLACQKFLPKNDIEKLPVLKIKELREGITENSDWATTDVEPEYIVKNGDVIFAWSASLMVKIWNGQDCILNQHLFKVTSDDYPKWFYFLWCKYHLDEFIAIAASHATTMGHIKRRDLDEAIVLVPSTNELEEMNSIADPLINKIIENNKQIRSLTALRNTLLPKLMSGEVRVEI
jgi:type I restriction enzyme S subunit